MQANRTARSQDDLKRELRNQLELLRISCDQYDRGTEAFAKYIAVSLRILLHKTRTSHPLLEQLGLRSGNFFASNIPLYVDSLISHAPLLMLALAVGPEVSEARYVPRVGTPGREREPRSIPFDDWWSEPILKDDAKNIFTRMSLVRHVADTDGGAHVDPQLDEAYMKLSRENSMGWTDARDNPLAGPPHLASIRQIAHELLWTLQETAPEYSEDAQPVLPDLNR